MLKVLFNVLVPSTRLSNTYILMMDDGPQLEYVGPEIESGWLSNIPTTHGQINCFTLKAKIENSLCNGTFTEWKSMHQGFRIYFAWNPRGIAIEPIESTNYFRQLSQIQDCAELAKLLEFQVHKIYSESLTHVLLPFEGPAEIFLNFI